MSTWVTKQEEDQLPHHHVPAATSIYPSPANAKAVKRLSKEGAAIILDFVNQQNGGHFQMSNAQAERLAVEIRSRTGYAEMSAAKVQEWLRRKRGAGSTKPKSQFAPPITPSTSVSSSTSSASQMQGSTFNFRYWTQAPVPGSVAPPQPPPPQTNPQTDPLTPSQIQILDMLISRFTDGVGDLQISTWANGLNVDPKLVENWAQNRHPIRTPPTPVSPTTTQSCSWLKPDSRSFADRIAQTSMNVHQRLPTPADTVSSAGSPVFSHASVPAQRSSPAISPRSPPPTNSTSNLASSNAMDVDSTLAAAPQNSVPSADSETQFIDPVVKGIVEAVKEAKHAPQRPGALPKTATELNALWAPFESKLNQLAETLAR